MSNVRWVGKGERFGMNNVKKIGWGNWSARLPCTPFTILSYEQKTTVVEQRNARVCQYRPLSIS